MVVLGVVTVSITLTIKRWRGRGRLITPTHSSPTSTVETLAWQLAAAGLTDSWDKRLTDKLPYPWDQRLAVLDF